MLRPSNIDLLDWMKALLRFAAIVSLLRGCQDCAVTTGIARLDAERRSVKVEKLLEALAAG